MILSITFYYNNNMDTDEKLLLIKSVVESVLFIYLLAFLRHYVAQPGLEPDV